MGLLEYQDTMAVMVSLYVALGYIRIAIYILYSTFPADCYILLYYVAS